MVLSVCSTSLMSGGFNGCGLIWVHVAVVVLVPGLLLCGAFQSVSVGLFRLQYSGALQKAYHESF